MEKVSFPGGVYVALSPEFACQSDGVTYWQPEAKFQTPNGMIKTINVFKCGFKGCKYGAMSRQLITRHIKFSHKTAVAVEEYNGTLAIEEEPARMEKDTNLPGEVEEIESPFVNLLPECIQLIALQLDPVSLVSFSLACTTFSCKMMSSDKSKVGVAKTKTRISKAEIRVPEANLPRTAKTFGVLGIPKNVKGQCIIYKSIKYDLPDLFDYWVNLLNPSDVDLDEMIRKAGKLTPKEKSLQWIGKIYSCIYSKPKMAQSGGVDWSAFTDGAIRSDDINHYISVVGEAQYKKWKEEGSDPNDEDSEEEEDDINLNIADSKYHSVFGEALAVGSLKIAEHFITQADGSVDEGYFRSIRAFRRAVHGSCDSLIWFLNRMPTNLTLKQKTAILRTAFNCMSTEPKVVEVLCTHPFFEDIDMSTAKIPVRSYDTNVAFELLSHRPELLKPLKLYRSFWRKSADPRAQPYLKELTIQEICGTWISCGTPMEIIDEILANNTFFPPNDFENKNFKEVFECIVDKWNIKEAAKRFGCCDPDNLVNFTKFLSKDWSSSLIDLLGEDIIPDEIITKAIKDRKLEEKLKDASNLGKKTAPRAKSKAARKPSPRRRRVPRDSDEELEEDY